MFITPQAKSVERRVQSYGIPPRRDGLILKMVAKGDTIALRSTLLTLNFSDEL